MTKPLFLECHKCGEKKSISSFLKVKSSFFPCGVTNVCTECLEDMIENENGNFNFMDRMFQWLGVPFLVDKWTKLYETTGAVCLSSYMEQVYEECYPMLDWGEVNEKYLELQKRDKLEDSIAALRMEKVKELFDKWGEEYSEKEVLYLEDLYQGILQTQNVNGKLQTDDAIKLCKISLIIDRKIRDGEDFEKQLKSYDTLRKSADFTPKNIKNACDFDSIGELFAYCEKKGWENAFYDNTPRDTVDLVMKDIQGWTRNLYKNETGIAEDVERRIQALKLADEMEETIMAVEDDGLDEFDSEGFDVDEFDEGAGL